MATALGLEVLCGQSTYKARVDAFLVHIFNTFYVELPRKTLKSEPVAIFYYSMRSMCYHQTLTCTVVVSFEQSMKPFLHCWWIKFVENVCHVGFVSIVRQEFFFQQI